MTMVRLVERFSKIKILCGGGHREVMEIHFDCPYCGTPDSYMVHSPSHCQVCQHLLPEYSKMRDTLIGRIMWHFEDDLDDMMIIV